MPKFSDFFKDKEGQVVIGQMPNSPLIGWFFITILSLVVGGIDARIDYLFSLLSFGFVFTWAWLEITSGVNYFRRILGLLILIFVVCFKFRAALSYMH